MIGYATIGTNDIEKAKVFYDAVFEPLGGKRTFAMGDRMKFYGAGETPNMLAISKPYNDEPASVGNGTMFGLPAATKEQVDAAYAAAMAAGGTCEGAPGARMPTFYAAYFRDLDGNKVCAFKFG